MTTTGLSAAQVAQMRAVAATLIPGDGQSPPADATSEFDRLLGEAALALGLGMADLRAALEDLPEEVSWTSLQAFCTTHPDHFELVANVAAGAYFMSPAVLGSLGYPTGARSAAPFDQAADELATGILDPVMERPRPIPGYAPDPS